MAKIQDFAIFNSSIVCDLLPHIVQNDAAIMKMNNYNYVL
jgi:hypothetical protein